MSLLGIFSIFSSAKKVIKESFEPTIPAENWANKELYHQDIMNGVSAEQRMKNLKNGKYKLTETYPEPHRDPKTGKIIIENCDLWRKDLREYGAYQVSKWVKQGKYNLTPDELKKQQEKFEKDMENLYRLVNNKSEPTPKQIEEKQQKEAQKSQIEQKEQDMLINRTDLLNECHKILLESNYNDVSFKFILKKPDFLEKDYGYDSASIVAKKHNENFRVEFNSIGRLSFEDGQKLFKSLSTILASVDIADFDNRESNLKESFIIEGLKLQENNQEFELLNDELSIAVDYSNPNHKILLKFYTSRINLSHKNFDAMDGHQFEHFCANVLKYNGFENVSVTSGSGDQGVDIIAYKDDIKYGIQCKCYHSDIGNKAVQEVYAGKTFYNCHIGVVLTNRDFTKSAIELARNNGVILWNRKKLLQMIENCKDKT